MIESGKINPMVHAVVLNYNDWRDTIECINSLLKINYFGKTSLIPVQISRISDSFKRSG